MTKLGRWGVLIITLGLIIGGTAGGSRAATVPAWAADPAFYTLWARADEPVAAGNAGRSWLWGPEPFAVANEPWAESSSGTRLVQYFDKARMEVNDPVMDPTFPYYISNGRLVAEMFHGVIQTGVGTFQAHAPAEIAVAGDGNDPAAPTYASFNARLSQPPPPATGPVTYRIERSGALTPVEPVGPPDATAPAATDATTGHSIPAVFLTWMNAPGPVQVGGQVTTGPVFDPLATLGHPISEAYWAAVTVAGQPRQVLVQLYERRVLTYNPANPPAFQVEMGNVGRHYVEWRYGGAGPGPALAVDPPTGPNAAFTVRGWNWPPATPVQLTGLARATGANVGLGQATAQANGQFTQTVTLTQALFDESLAGPRALVLVAQTAEGAQRALLPLVVRQVPPTPTPLPPPATMTPAPPIPAAPGPNPPPPIPPSGERQIIVPLSGTILSVDGGARTVSLDIPENEPVTLLVDGTTQITVGGAPAALGALRSGQVADVQAVRQPDAADGTLRYHALLIAVP
jgi:hypothetical protein